MREANPDGRELEYLEEYRVVLERASAVGKVRVPKVRVRAGEVEHVTGTGWLISPGLLLTCWHVIECEAPWTTISPRQPYESGSSTPRFCSDTRSPPAGGVSSDTPRSARRGLRLRCAPP